MKKTFDILRKGDFNYLTLTLHFFPDFVFTKNGQRLMETDTGVELSAKFPTEIVYLDTRFEDGEKYFWLFSLRILGFGFSFKRQTSY